jgi:hypothetical protein
VDGWRSSGSVQDADVDADAGAPRYGRRSTA